MSDVPKSTFFITREGQIVEPKRVFVRRLFIGCDEGLDKTGLYLNDGAVARDHGKIVRVNGRFHFVNHSRSSPVTLNSTPVPHKTAPTLSTGDKIQIGPFFLNVTKADEEKGTFRISVVRIYGVAVGEREDRHAATPMDAEDRSADDVVDQLYFEKRKRKRPGRLSPLHSKATPIHGMERFNWVPTKDLLRPWPVGVFGCAALLVAALSVAAAVYYRKAYAPAPVSAPHARTDFALSPALARQPGGGSCTSCHALDVSAENRGKMNENCAACHRTEAFLATTIRPHREAGITCIDCHAEHGGKDFRPMRAGLESCAKCHADGNKNLYKGKGVRTPHDGTYGYPVVDGVWVWKGLDDEGLAERPEIVKLLKENRVAASDAQRWRNVQFHGVHLGRVRAFGGVGGVANADGAGELLSCSSCHRSGHMGADVDRKFPRKTCGGCHNARIFDRIQSTPAGAETPSCSSCHVEHLRDVNRDASLLRAGFTVSKSASER
jgi:hypothetical protein